MTPAFYPALFSNPLGCPCPVHFTEAQRGKTEHRQGQKVSPGGWPIFWHLGVSSALLMKFQGTKPFLVTTARKLPYTAFHSLGGIRMLSDSQEFHKPPHNAKQGPSRFWAVVRTGTGSYWQRKPCPKNLRLRLRFSKFFWGTRWIKVLSLITA